MKRLVHYKLRKESWWLTTSGIFMGIAFFLQALDFLALRAGENVSGGQLVLFMIIPMLLEAAWFVLVREKVCDRAEVTGIVGGLLCLTLLVQTLFAGNFLLILIGILMFALAAAVIVLITWGFIHHRALGMLVFFAVAVVRVMLYGALPAVFSWNAMALIQEIPVIFVILAMMLFFRGIYAQKAK